MDGAHERAGACGKLVGCIMYLSLYLLSWELLCHRNDFQRIARYLRNAILLIYRPDPFFSDHFVATVLPALASVRDRHRQRT